MQDSKGFTLIELMIVVVILAIIAAIAIPNYQETVRKNKEAKAQQEILKVAEQLERHRARNFNYRNFSATNVQLPRDYSLNVYDLDDNTKGLGSDVQGRGWYIKVTPDSHPKNHYFLMGSNGLKCKSIIEADVNFKCEPWNESTKAGSQPW